MSTVSVRLGDLLTRNALQAPERAALVTPGRAALTFGAWSELAGLATDDLARAGIGASDRLAVVLPSGPVMVAVTVALSSRVVLALLDPASRENELERALVRLGATGVVVPGDGGERARAVAARLQLPLVEVLAERGGPAGAFALRCAPWPAAVRARSLDPEVAFLAMSSGTTGAPKVVELTEGNFTASGAAFATAVALAADDRCLSVAATFHVSAMFTLAASLHAGSGTVYLPALDVETFAAALRDEGVSWLVAPPATQRAILAHFTARRELLQGMQLRFVRCGSAPLDLQLWGALEELYAAPVLQSYGMTEVPTISICPLPPRPQARGSVGVPIGCELAIRGDDGRRLDGGETGEVIVRGPTVMHGYDDPVANGEAFVDGWFRTGDLGSFDGSFLTLAGRRKELINRGGLTVFPFEIETLMREDVGIADVAVFSIPHATLGEEVAAAIVLQPGARRSESDVRRFAAERISAAKVPKRVAFVAELPRTSTGKVVRHELHALLERTASDAADRHARSILEAHLLELFEDVLAVTGLNRDDDFFSCGGDSLRATRLLVTLSAACERELSMADLFAASTPRTLAARVLAALPVATDAVVRVQAGTKTIPLFFLNGDLDGGGVYVRTFARALDPERTVYSLPPHGTNGVPGCDSIEAMAADYTERIVRAFGEGPYLLGGYCNGGVVAFEIARQLRARNASVGPVMLVAATAGNAPFARLRALVGGAARAFGQRPERAEGWYLGLRSRAIALAHLRGAALSAYGAFVVDQARAFACRLGLVPPLAVPDVSAAVARMTPILGRYHPGCYDGPVHHFWADDDVPPLPDRTLGWGSVAPQLVLHRVPGDHFTVVTREGRRLADAMRPLLAEFG